MLETPLLTQDGKVNQNCFQTLEKGQKALSSRNYISFAAGIYGAEAAQLNANATDSIINGMDLFREAAEKLGAVNPKIAQGNLFEYIEAAKFNADAVLKDSSLKAFVTAAEGNPHATADLLIKDGERVVQEVTVAAGVIDIGASVYSFAQGEITSEELIERIGQTGTCTAYSLYLGAAGGAVLGPVGAVVGSMAGYLIAASIYQSATAIFKEARLAEAEAERVSAMCDMACKIMQEQRAEFERLFKVNFQIRCAEFDTFLTAIDAGLSSNNYAIITQSLSNFAILFGQKLQFETFEEFDDFMMNSDEPLIL